MIDELKFPEDFVNKIICGDCLKIIKKIPDNSVDVILTDPPYGLNKEGIQNDADLSVFYKPLPEWDRVLKENSWFITFFSTKFLPMLFKNNPFSYFWQIALYCPEGMVKSPIGITKVMSCFVFKKGNPKIVHRNKDIFIDTPGKMVEPDEGFINHPTPKPKQFIKEILRMFTKENDLILDPFIGSGSTAVACSQLNRDFIGFEINQNYVKIANKRLINIGKGYNDR
ncbi:MAG: DNA methyltransferase [Euryarchaeota archaeon]|nr:DNA methyltransferase [Euryarchaeota archaeon]